MRILSIKGRGVLCPGVDSAKGGRDMFNMVWGNMKTKAWYAHAMGARKCDMGEDPLSLAACSLRFLEFDNLQPEVA